MKSEKEFVGTLRGFDDYVNIVLDDVTEIDHGSSSSGAGAGAAATGAAAAAAAGPRKTKLESILLNGNNIAMLVPGSDPAVAAAGAIGAAAPPAPT
jgi:U6 snRNA-associated Sm-like protein LSm5